MKAPGTSGLLLAMSVLAPAVTDAQPFRRVALRSPYPDGGSSFGISVASAGDVDQDGLADVIIGAQGDSPGSSPDGAGRAYVFGAPERELLLELVSPHETFSGVFGTSVAGAGDVNQDGFPDLIVGAPGEFSGGGRAYVFSGQNGSLLLELSSPNEEANGQFGIAVAGAGDANGDAVPDLIVGAQQESPAKSPFVAGRAYIFNGQGGTLLFELVSPTEVIRGHFGEAVAGAGDVNQDGFADVVVGAFLEDPGGRAHVFSGKDGTALLELTSPNFERLGYFGYSVSAAGDLNQDGVPDLIVGAPQEDPGTSPDAAGRVYAFSGQDASLILELSSPNENEDAGRFPGVFGLAVASAGDVDQDGIPDLIVGAPGEDPGKNPENVGRAYVFSGQDQSLLLQLASEDRVSRFGQFGGSVAGLGDSDGDGLPDLVVGAPGESPHVPSRGEGRTYVYLSDK